jgi:putative alpha-1,2-mannosidase
VLSDRVLLFLFLFCFGLVYVWNLIATGGTVLANAWYWAGNEPNILSPWMFGFAGHQYQNYTNYWTRWLVDNAYGTTGTNGLPGNDDFGTLSTWLTWSMLGIYPLAGTQRFVIGAPRFASVCIARSSISSSSGGSSSDAMGDFCVIGHNVNRGTHITKCELNGAVLDEPMFDWNKISHTSSPSTLEIWMSETPGQWG